MILIATISLANDSAIPIVETLWISINSPIFL